MAEVESKPQSPSTPPSANGVDSKRCSTRILRAREGKGDNLKTEDFEVFPTAPALSLILNILGARGVFEGFGNHGTEE